MKVIVCGTRNVIEEPYKTRLFHVLTELNEEYGISRIYHGDCKTSPDIWGQEWAEENNVYVETFPADWSRGRGAGHKRNAEMTEEALRTPDSVYCIAVWDGKSSGTAGMIKECVVREIGVEIIPAKMD